MYVNRFVVGLYVTAYAKTEIVPTGVPAYFFGFYFIVDP